MSEEIGYGHMCASCKDKFVTEKDSIYCNECIEELNTQKGENKDD